ncbi:MAG: hypothetical protein IMW94_01455 [Thermoanaerobacter sp.]|jgi:hypothetical protein|nr:hypothetical protein [Thermoanaerobacter sp.]
MPRDPLYLVFATLAAAVRSACGQEITVKAEYPSPAYFRAVLPAVGLLHIGGTARDAVAPGEIHAAYGPNPDGTLPVACEYRRYHYLIQLSVFAATKKDRRSLGQAIVEYLERHRYLPLAGDALADYTRIRILSTPHDHPGETGFYQRDYTLEATGRLLIAENFYPAEEIITRTQLV